MRDQLLPAHGVQVRRVNEAVPRGGIGNHKYKWSFVSVSLCVCSVFVLYRFRAVCAHCVCVLVVCSVRAYLHKDIRFTLTDYALCAVFADFYGENIVLYIPRRISHISHVTGPPLGSYCGYISAVAPRASAVGARVAVGWVALRAARRGHALAQQSARRGTRVAHTHASQEAATLVAT